MNWQAVQIVLFVGFCMVTVWTMSATAAGVGFDPPRRTLAYAVLTAALFCADALLAGMVWA